MRLIQFFGGYLLIIFFILNGISAIVTGKYLGQNGTYKSLKEKYPKVTQKKFSIFDGCLYILTAIGYFIKSLELNFIRALVISFGMTIFDLIVFAIKKYKKDRTNS